MEFLIPLNEKTTAMIYMGGLPIALAVIYYAPSKLTLKSAH
ncbi:MAG: hypothetical protein ACYCQI_07110 [Gammaproteobacteria bacterium]